MKWLIIILIIISLVLVTFIYFQRAKIENLSAKNIRLEQENQSLNNERNLNRSIQKSRRKINERIQQKIKKVRRTNEANIVDMLNVEFNRMQNAKKNNSEEIGSSAP